MLENTGLLIILGIGGGILLLIFVALVVSRLYHRASKEISFVRTGWRGQKVIMNGGAMVLPVLQEIIPVNMNTQRLEVQRGAEAALITRDRMRVDVRAEFYVRVKPTAEAIADAAQTLGRRTINPQALKELVEGKFVDALRAVAAGMRMEELHENRVDFVQKVQHAVSEDLLKNGLELESVSLTALDQTEQSFFNPNNAFDAQGLTRLTEEIEARRKQRNDIERDTEVQIRGKDLEAEQHNLGLAREEEYARMTQEREIAVRRAEEATVTAREEAEKQRQAEEARIAAKQRVDQAGILSERAVEEERIEKDRQLREREIDKSRTVELADQERAIAIAEKSKSQSHAEAEANKAKALMVQAEEQVVTARDTEVAERQKAVELVKASEEAEREAIGVKVHAQAERAAAADRAEAVRTEAQADADKVRLEAEAAAERYQVDAEGKRMLNEAENVLAPEIIEMQVKMTIVRNLEAIIRESVKPMERIDGIKIYQVEGLGGVGGNGQRHEGGNAAGSLAEQVVDSALRYRGQAPLLDALLKEIGLAGDLHGLGAAAAVRQGQSVPVSEASVEGDGAGSSKSDG